MMTFLSTVLAQESVAVTAGGQFAGTITDFSLTEIISWAVTVILVVAGLIFFFMLVVGGLRWILSGGDKAATESARGQITAALIGLVIVFSAWAIATLITTIFGINIIALEIPKINQ
jgi:hypothetical protein